MKVGELRKTCGLYLYRTGEAWESRNKSQVANELARIRAGNLWKRSGQPVFHVLTYACIIYDSNYTDG